MRLLQEINDTNYKLGELHNKFWEIYDREIIEEEMCLGMDDWIGRIYYDKDKNEVSFFNAHTEYTNRITKKFDELPIKEHREE